MIFKVSFAYAVQHDIGAIVSLLLMLLRVHVSVL